MGIHRPLDFDITNRAGTKKYADGSCEPIRAICNSPPGVVITDLRNRADEIAP